MEFGASAAQACSDTLPNDSPGNGRAPTAAPPAGARPGVPPTNPEPPAWLTPAYLFRVLRHRWRPLLVAGVLGAAAGFGIDRALPPSPVVYATHALIRVEPADGLPGAAPGRAEARDLRTQAELVKTRFILLAAVEQGPAAELPSVRQDHAAVLKRLASDLKVDPVGPQLLRVSLTGSDPAELPVLVNAVKDAYLREVVGSEQGRRLKRKDFLEAAYRDCEARLRDKRGDLAGAESKVGATGGGERPSFERFALLQNELLRIEMDLHRSRLESALAGRDKDEGGVPPATVEDLAEKDPVVRQHRGRIAQLDEKIVHWERTTTSPEAHEAYTALRRDRQALADAVEGRRRDLVRQYTDMAAASRQKRAGEAQNRAARLEEEEKLVRGLVARGWNELEQRTKGDPALTLRRFEVERLEGIAKQVTDELEGLRLEANAVARTASVQDAAEPVVNRASRQPLRTGLAVGLPLLLVVACVAGWEFLARRIYGPADVRESLGLRVLGSVPRLPGRGRPPARPGNDWPSPLTDAVDALCAALPSDPGTGAGPRVIMVTSAAPGEGKSTLARHLAARLARAGKKTLLVDADLYRPAVHTAFGLPAGPGLGEVLCGTVPAAAIHATPTADLFVLTAGAAGPAAFRELARGALGPVLADLRTGFDAVVIDTSPVLATTQPLLAGRHADAVIMSTLAGVSRSTLVAEAVGRLSELGVPVAGVVVNRAAEASRYGYYFRPAAPTPAATPAGC